MTFEEYAKWYQATDSAAMPRKRSKISTRRPLTTESW